MHHRSYRRSLGWSTPQTQEEWQLPAAGGGGGEFLFTEPDFQFGKMEALCRRPVATPQYGDRETEGTRKHCVFLLPLLAWTRTPVSHMPYRTDRVCPPHQGQRSNDFLQVFQHNI